MIPGEFPGDGPEGLSPFKPPNLRVSPAYYLPLIDKQPNSSSGIIFGRLFSKPAVKPLLSKNQTVKSGVGPAMTLHNNPVFVFDWSACFFVIQFHNTSRQPPPRGGGWVVS